LLHASLQGCSYILIEKEDNTVYLDEKTTHTFHNPTATTGTRVGNGEPIHKGLQGTARGVRVRFC